MSDDPTEVVPHDQRWAERFAVAERELRVPLAPFVLDIEHIGSTAVPRLAAKPVIDIQVGVRALDDSGEIVAAVESLGYEYVPEFEDALPDRRYFRRWAEERRTPSGSSRRALEHRLVGSTRPVSRLASKPRRRPGSLRDTQAEALGRA